MEAAEWFERFWTFLFPGFTIQDYFCWRKNKKWQCPAVPAYCPVLPAAHRSARLMIIHVKWIYMLQQARRAPKVIRGITWSNLQVLIKRRNQWKETEYWLGGWRSPRIAAQLVKTIHLLGPQILSNAFTSSSQSLIGAAESKQLIRNYIMGGNTFR